MPRRPDPPIPRPTTRLPKRPTPIPEAADQDAVCSTINKGPHASLALRDGERQDPSHSVTKVGCWERSAFSVLKS